MLWRSEARQRVRLSCARQSKQAAGAWVQGGAAAAGAKPGATAKAGEDEDEDGGAAAPPASHAAPNGASGGEEVRGSAAPNVPAGNCILACLDA